MRKLLCVLTVCMSLGILIYSGPLRLDLGWAQGFDLLELCKQTDEELRLCLQVELESRLGLVSIPVPPADAPLQPVQRIPRQLFGVVGAAPLDATDLNALIFPNANAREREAVLAGLEFFTTEQTAATGRGAVSNQPNCLGCHRNSEDAVNGLVQTVSPVSRASRSTPTNFDVTAGDQDTGGVAADVDLVLNPTPDLDNPGRTAAFTIFGDFCTAGAPCQQRGLPGSFDGLARAPFFGFVQHTRPSVPSCLPDRLPSIAEDPNLAGLDPDEGWMADWVSPAGFRRQVAERAAPPYIGRGLMETIPDQDIFALADPNDDRGAPVLGCPGDCISGRPNMATTIQTINGGDTVPRLGRFGLRAQGPQLIVFDAVGAQEEVGTTSVLRFTENIGPEGCIDGVPDPDIRLETIFSLRNLIRLMTLPEFGDTLLGLLQSPDPTAPQPAGSHAARVQRGAMLFGLDLIAFANRMIPGRIPPGGDGRNRHAINADTPMLNCAGCHTPVHRTGRSRATVGARHLSHVWAPIFADMLLHNMPVINAERFAPTPRLPVVVNRLDVNTFDLPRNFGEDALPNQGLARGDEFRTAPLMGLGRIGPPFFHDVRVYLAQGTRDTAPASTVMTSSEFTNAPLVVRSLDDAIRAAIELHDLPAPDDANMPNVPGAGCPVPPGGLVRVGDVVYPADVEQAICPPLNSPNRSEAREVIRRYRALSDEDQQALIEFLKEL
jgi:hypothetical protein